MAARLAFSVAMLADADILLLDEVLAVGDARFREKCLRVFDHYKREKRTTVLVSHDLSTLELYCDRVLLMLGGRLMADGAPSDVTAQYRRFTSARAEGERKPDGDGLMTTPSSRRYGARELEILAIRLLDERGRRHQAFLTGESLTVEVDYVSNSAAGAFTCVIGFGPNNGRVFLSGPQTDAKRGDLPRISPGSRGTIVYRIPALPMLNVNSCLLTVGLYDEHRNHLYDRIDHAQEFQVTDAKGRHGLIDMAGEWSHREEAAPGLEDSGAVA
jgi:hypothetical protein